VFHAEEIWTCCDSFSSVFDTWASISVRNHYASVHNVELEFNQIQPLLPQCTSTCNDHDLVAWFIPCTFIALRGDSFTQKWLVLLQSRNAESPFAYTTVVQLDAIATRRPLL